MAVAGITNVSTWSSTCRRGLPSSRSVNKLLLRAAELVLGDGNVNELAGLIVCYNCGETGHYVLSHRSSDNYSMWCPGASWGRMMGHSHMSIVCIRMGARRCEFCSQLKSDLVRRRDGDMTWSVWSRDACQYEPQLLVIHFSLFLRSWFAFT